MIEDSLIGFTVGGSHAAPTVVVSGEIDLATAPLLRDALAKLIERGAVDITLDFDEVTFLDSSGLGVLVAAMQRVADVGGQIDITRPRENVRRIFEITGLDTRFGI